MAATEFQAEILKRIARSRIDGGATLPLLPAEKAGTCVVGPDGNLFRGSDEELCAALDAGAITFHEGKIGGAWPRIVER